MATPIDTPMIFLSSVKNDNTMIKGLAMIPLAAAEYTERNKKIYYIYLISHNSSRKIFIVRLRDSQSF